MAYLVVCLVSLVVSGLALFSGFGLGTLLMPALAFFFPLETAIAATAVVHLVNNLFKVALVGRWAARSVVVRFGVPAVLAALGGAALLSVLAERPPLHAYTLGPLHAEVTVLKIVLAGVLAALAILDLWPGKTALQFSPAVLPVGGIVSGFFGGLAGMQGALRAAFLVRAGLSRDQFIGTTAVVSTGVDMARLIVYALGLVLALRAGRNTPGWSALREPGTAALVGTACVAAILGTLLGSRLVEKVTLRQVQRLIGALLLAMAGMLAAGIV